jgi:Cdc6-like AAA superfamily ATPase
MAVQNSRLWLHGIPGAGKTILASLVIEEALKNADKEHAVAFFYCDYKNVASQRPVNILGSIASQIARQDEQCLHTLEDYYRSCNPQGSLQRSPKADDLRDLILHMATFFKDISIIVDGLDECGKTTVAAVELLDSFSSSGENIKTLFLSREEQHIKDILNAHVQISIAARSSDLKLYVASEMELRIRKKRLRLQSNQLKEHIMDRLVNGAAGM